MHTFKWIIWYIYHVVSDNEVVFKMARDTRPDGLIYIKVPSM